jgi:hypothetical protein
MLCARTKQTQVRAIRHRKTSSTNRTWIMWTMHIHTLIRKLASSSESTCMFAIHGLSLFHTKPTIRMFWMASFKTIRSWALWSLIIHAMKIGAHLILIQSTFITLGTLVSGHYITIVANRHLSFDGFIVQSFFAIITTQHFLRVHTLTCRNVRTITGLSNTLTFVRTLAYQLIHFY